MFVERSQAREGCTVLKSQMSRTHERCTNAVVLMSPKKVSKYPRKYKVGKNFPDHANAYKVYTRNVS